MSLKLQAIGPIPEQTVKVAKAAFPNGNTYMKMRDELGVFFSDEQFADLFSTRGQPALSPWRLALVTIMQYAENLTDRQAADAVRARIDWKYALGLELSDPGFNYSVLSEFRDRLIQGEAAQLLLEKMLSRFKDKGLLKSKGKQRTDSTHVLAKIRTLNRLELVAETMIHALNVLATVVPDWLKEWVPGEWYDRYEKRIDEYRLPKEKKERQMFAETIGADGHLLLKMVYSQAPDWLSSIPSIETMRQIWVQQYYIQEGKVNWRTKSNLPPPAVMISSPHDTDARYSRKRETTWVGYKVHLTESCDKDVPHLITSVQTTVGTEPDNNVTEKIHEGLNEQQLLPSEHLADMAYGSVELLFSSRSDYGIEFVCPMRPDNSWQARTEGAFDLSYFTIDWQNQKVVCPQGKDTVYWKETKRDGYDKILAKFHQSDCQVCPSQNRCTKSRAGHRELTFPPQEEYLALQSIRQFQTTEDFKERYAKRAGIEGTISQATYALKMRRARYRGVVKTHLQHVLTSCAINLKRVVDWLNEKPQKTTKNSRFADLAA